MRLDVDFRMTEDGKLNGNDITFEFSGDDDVWVYIDDKLVLDIGGHHREVGGQINFRTGEVVVYSADPGIEFVGDERTFMDNDPTGYSLTSMDINGDGTPEDIIRQPNIYEALGKDLTTFAAQETHTLRIYYMDRAKGMSNNKIRFNLPQNDTLTVTKKVASTYTEEIEGRRVSTGDAISTEDRTKLGDRFDFTLLENGEAAVNKTYTLRNADGSIVADSNGNTIFNTGSSGQFTLEEGQKAIFYPITLDSQHNYQVVENLPDTAICEGIWTYTAQGTSSSTGSGKANVSQAVAVSGTEESVETINFVCTNTIVRKVNTIVIDYGKPVDFDLGRVEAWPLGMEESWAETAVCTAITTVGAYGTAAPVDQDKDGKAESIRYTPNAVLSTVDTVHYRAQFTLGNGAVRELCGVLRIVPASMMYYETDFAEDVFTLGSKDGGSDWETASGASGTGGGTQDAGTIHSDYYAKPVSRPEESEYLYFDFDNDEAAWKRYENPFYMGRNFDSNETRYWVTATSPKTCSIDEGAGTLTVHVGDKTTGTAGSTLRYGPSVFTTSTPGPGGDKYTSLNFDSQAAAKAEYAQIRFKLQNCIVDTGSYANEQARVVFRYRYTDKSGNGKEGQPRSNYTFVNDQYITVTIPLDESFKTAERIGYIGFRFQHIKQATEAGGTVEIDYIYVGPKAGLPDSNTLFFGFDNSEAAQNRYTKNPAYNGLNFDTEANGYWVTSNTITNNADFKIDNVTGTLTVPVGANPSGEIYGPSVFTTTMCGKGAAYKNSSLTLTSELVEKAEVVQIRFKLRNCAFDGGGHNYKTPRLVWRYLSVDEDGKAVEKIPAFNYSFVNDQYQTVTIPLDENFKKSPDTGYIGFRFQNIKQATEAGGAVEIDYIYVGPMSDMPNPNPDPVYGYDSSYADDATYSDGSSLKAFGQGRTKTTVDFEFTGTGFDIISATGAEQGTIRVTYTNVDTGVSKYRTVNNKSDSDLNLYQIPVVTVEDLAYGTYRVRIGVSEKFVPPAGAPANLYNGNEFYFDAIRIYNPIDTSAGANGTGDSKLAYNAYIADKEANPDLQEIRNALIYGEDGSFTEGTVGGFGFVDYYYGTGGGVAELTDYTNIGPNNEVYLAKNQSVVFKVEVSSVPVGIDIGAKSADGNPVKMTATIGTSKTVAPTNTRTEDISTSTALFYDLMKDCRTELSKIFASGYAYVTVSNTGDGILSLTDVKLTFRNPNPIISYSVDAETLQYSTFALARVFSASLPVVKNGIVEENGGLYYYVNDELQCGAGLIMLGGQYYYIRSSGQAAVGEYWVTNTNDLLPQGFYTFLEDGSMRLRNGIVDVDGTLYYYVNDQIQYGAGLIQLDGNYYYIRSSGQAAVGEYWVTNTNDLLPQGFYTFLEDGTMRMRNGVIAENGGLYYYVKDKLQAAAGLIELNGSYYYIRSNGQAAVGKYWITNTHGLMDEGFYTFGEDGKMLL